MRAFLLPPLPDMHPQIALLAASLQEATREWRLNLGEVPEECVVWQPHREGHSIGALVLHMADVESAWIETIAARRRRPPGEAARLLAEETKQYAGKWPTPPSEPLEWYLQLQDEIRARTLRTLSTFDDPDSLVTRASWDAELSIRWIVNHVVLHEAYHGGQAVLLRHLWERR